MAPPDLAALRPRAFAVGYRMLGSVAEAEDIAQETLLRVSMLAPPPDEPMAWVTTVATRQLFSRHFDLLLRAQEGAMELPDAGELLGQLTAAGFHPSAPRPIAPGAPVVTVRAVRGG